MEAIAVVHRWCTPSEIVWHSGYIYEAWSQTTWVQILLYP